MTKELGDERVFFHEGVLEFLVNGLHFSIPSLMLSDGYSVPPLFRGIFPKSMGGLLAAIAHDFLYSVEGALLCSRKEADAILRTLMQHYGHGGDRHIVWGSVRIGGWKSYDKRTIETYQGE
jgi:hypothetical protein